MTEPRMRLRQKGQQFPPQDLENFLIAFGDSEQPLPETIKVLDEIVTDYIIESCHEAAAVATHARRAKIKLDDFKFMLRRDTAKLGRVSEMLEKEKELKKSRKIFDTDEGTIAKGADKAPESGKEKDKENAAGDGLERDAASEVGKKGGKARSVSGRTDGGEEERRKKKRKKDRGSMDVASVRSG